MNQEEKVQIMRKIKELEQEEKEHRLVLDAFERVEKTRRCFRLIGTTLVEKTVGDIETSVAENLDIIKVTTENLRTQLNWQKKRQFFFMSNGREVPRFIL